MEEKLHQLGIFTFEQVSKMTDTEYDLLDSIIDEFPGVPKRDDWAGQAAKLKIVKLWHLKLFMLFTTMMTFSWMP